MASTSGLNFSSLRRRTPNQSSQTTDICRAEDSKNGSNTQTIRKKNGTLIKSTAESSYLMNQVLHPEELHKELSPPSSNPSSFTASGDASYSVSECLKDDFYDVPCEQLARALLGKILVRRLDCGHILKGRIVETECYLGGEDQASHSYRGKMTERNAPMFMKPGTTYVYFTYGMYHCFNISSQGAGAAVLIRAVDPVDGLDKMAELRARGVKNKKPKAPAVAPADEDGGNKTKKKKAKPPLKPHELCSGPSKLCIAMDIDRDSCNKRDLASWPGLYVQEESAASGASSSSSSGASAVVVVSKRVGIESAGREWADAPLRFYLLGNPSVSKRDRGRERELAERVDSLAEK